MTSSTVKQAGQALQTLMTEAEELRVKLKPDAWLWLQNGQPVNAFLHEPSMNDDYWEGRGFSKKPLWTFIQDTFQARVAAWAIECFGEEETQNQLIRCDRKLEEDLEFLQSVNYPKERIPALVEYVYNRPKGEPSQEIGGVMVTTAALCHAFGIDMQLAAETELARINQPEIIEKIRAKQAKKAADIPFSPLPQAVDQDQDVTMSAAELNLVRQWFECTQDLSHTDYLKKDDYQLAEKIYAKLGFRVPNSVADSAKAA
jgi:hypothetical protein